MLFHLASDVLSANRFLPLTARSSLILRLFLVPILLVSVQLYHAFTLREHFQTMQLDHLHSRVNSSFHERTDWQSNARLKPSESFGACLMIKEDNDLLFEWLAYHYTTLPLRYVFVGSDEGNTQDPIQVLQRWKDAGTGLQFWVVNATDFHRRGAHSSSFSTSATQRRGIYSVEHEEAHHSFVHRQRSFITTCVKFLKSQGLEWVTLIDTDEFLVMNSVGSAENITAREVDVNTGNNRRIIDPIAFQQRHTLPSLESQGTVLEAIRTIESIHTLGPCYTVPRLLYGALENVTCEKATSDVQLARSKFRYEELSTLRFTQHAKKGDFAKSKYGKVIIDVSQLSNETIERAPRNIHRPYKPECGPGAVGNFAESLFYLNHYIGSWERYASRKDFRRNRVEWELRAHLTAGNSCEHEVFRWISRFVAMVGEVRAQYLLGGERTSFIQE